MAKALKEAAKLKKLIPDAYLFFFTAIVLNYVWRTLHNFMFTVDDKVPLVIPILGADMPLVGGWTPFNIISILVWLLSLYSLYILFAMVRKKERFAWSLALLILGALFYLMTIFF